MWDVKFLFMKKKTFFGGRSIIFMNVWRWIAVFKLTCEQGDVVYVSISYCEYVHKQDNFSGDFSQFILPTFEENL